MNMNMNKNISLYNIFWLCHKILGIMSIIYFVYMVYLASIFVLYSNTVGICTYNKCTFPKLSIYNYEKCIIPRMFNDGGGGSSGGDGMVSGGGDRGSGDRGGGDRGGGDGMVSGDRGGGSGGGDGMVSGDRGGGSGGGDISTCYYCIQIHDYIYVSTTNDKCINLYTILTSILYYFTIPTIIKLIFFYNYQRIANKIIFYNQIVNVNTIQTPLLQQFSVCYLCFNQLNRIPLTTNDYGTSYVIIKTQCNHYYCYDCMLKWKNNNCTHCPKCLQSVYL